MPRRKIRTLPPSRTPLREIIVSSIHPNAGKLLRSKANEAFRRTPHKSSANYFRILNAVVDEKRTSLTNRMERPLTHTEKEDFKRVLVHLLEKTFSKADPQKRKRLFQAFFDKNSSLESFFADVARVNVDEYPVVREQVTAFRDAVFLVGTAYLLRQEVNARGWNESLENVVRILGSLPESKTNFMGESYFENAGKMLVGVQRKLVAEGKARRSEQLKENFLNNKNRYRFREAISRFDMPRAQRRLIFSDAMEQILKGESGPRDRIREKGFKQGRLAMREQLTRLGFSPDLVFLRMGLDKIDKRAMTRLKTMTYILRKAKTTREKQASVERLLDKYHPPGMDAQSLQSISRVHQSLNPLKEAARKERAERKAEHTPTPAKKVEKKLPSTVGGYLSLFSKEKRITDEQVVGLSKLFHSIKLREHREVDVDRLVEHMILSVLATHFQKSGRVSERALRELTVPQLLHPHFKRSIFSLRKKGLVEYESHAGHSDFVSLPNKTASKTLGKYNTKLSRLGENGS